MGLKALGEELGVNITKADQIMGMYLGRIPEIVAFRNECQDLVYQDGYVDCLFDKRYHAEAHDAYKMVNKRVQGGCAQILKVGYLQVLALFKEFPCYYKAKLVLPIHDELIFERRTDAPELSEQMFVEAVKIKMECIPQLLELGLRLRVDVKKSTTNWAEKVPL
jgi:DNA polymerase I-like protein with 3'-5' exonuclease and polymerase domains